MTGRAVKRYQKPTAPRRDDAVWDLRVNTQAHLSSVTAMVVSFRIAALQ